MSWFGSNKYFFLLLFIFAASPVFAKDADVESAVLQYWASTHQIHQNVSPETLQNHLFECFDSEQFLGSALHTIWPKWGAFEKQVIHGHFKEVLSLNMFLQLKKWAHQKAAGLVIYFTRKEGDFAQVKAHMEHGKKKIKMEFALKQSGGKWKVFNVVVEKASLLTNWQAQFEKILSYGGYAELEKNLNDKWKELNRQISSERNRHSS